MSATTTQNDGGERRERHPAVRVFASEFLNAEYSFTTSDSDLAPKYTLLPTGKRVNRVLIVGAATDVEVAEYDHQTFVNARVHDGDQYFYISASEYQPNAMQVLRDIDTPAHVAIVGKPKHWENNSGELVIEVRPESVSIVTRSDRMQWVLETAAQTNDRIQQYVHATEDNMPRDVELAQQQYDIDPRTYLGSARDVIEMVI
jgi:RPA family protein